LEKPTRLYVLIYCICFVLCVFHENQHDEFLYVEHDSAIVPKMSFDNDTNYKYLSIACEKQINVRN